LSIVFIRLTEALSEPSTRAAALRLCQATRDVTSSLGWTTREARRPDRPDHLGAPTRGRDLPGGRRGHLGEARHGSTSRTAMRPTTRYRPFDRDRHSEETNSSETSRASATKHDGATPRATPRARGRARRGAQTSGKGREPTGGRSRGSRRADARGTRSRELEELTTLAGWRSREVEKSRRSWDDNPTSKDLGDEGPETQKVPRGPRGASRLVLYLGRSLSLEESALYIEPWRSSRRSGLKASRTPERFATRQFSSLLLPPDLLRRTSRPCPSARVLRLRSPARSRTIARRASDDVRASRAARAGGVPVAVPNGLTQTGGRGSHP
jgi:hypothetical protein